VRVDRKRARCGITTYYGVIFERNISVAADSPCRHRCDVRNSIASMGKARTMLGHNNLAEGLRQTYEWFVRGEWLIRRTHERRGWLTPPEARAM
jgi:hypothetical protein